jgi:hypothetical protein
MRWACALYSPACHYDAADRPQLQNSDAASVVWVWGCSEQARNLMGRSTQRSVLKRANCEQTDSTGRLQGVALRAGGSKCRPWFYTTAISDTVQLWEAKLQVPYRILNRHTSSFVFRRHLPSVSARCEHVMEWLFWDVTLIYTEIKHHILPKRSDYKTEHSSSHTHHKSHRLFLLPRLPVATL